MRVLNTKLNDVLVIKPKLHGDNRGFFMESWNKREFDQAIGKEVSFFFKIIILGRHVGCVCVVCITG